MLTENVLIVDIKQCQMIAIGHAEQCLGSRFPFLIIPQPDIWN